MTRVVIEAIDYTRMVVVLDSGATLPITALLDGEGDLTEDLSEAVAFTAGTPLVGFVAASLSDFGPRVLH